MADDPVVTAMVADHQFLITFLGAFFLGESVIVTVTSVAARNGWPILMIVVAAFLGTVLADGLWFLLGGRLRSVLDRFPRAEKRWEQAEKYLDELPVHEHPFWVILAIKFLYGSRIAMIICLAAYGVRFRTFALYDSVATVLWLGVVVPVGYAMGMGLARALPVLNVVQMAAIVLATSFVLFQVVRLWLRRRLITK